LHVVQYAQKKPKRERLSVFFLNQILGKANRAREAFTLTKASDSCPRGGDFVSRPHFIKIAKSVLKSRFCAISSDFCNFTWFQPDFTHFRFFQAIQPVMHVLTRKIVRFYESKRDFNNLGHHDGLPACYFPSLPINNKWKKNNLLFYNFEILSFFFFFLFLVVMSW
jgi:hypothetical protein